MIIRGIKRIQFMKSRLLKKNRLGLARLDRTNFFLDASRILGTTRIQFVSPYSWISSSFRLVEHETERNRHF